MPKFLEDKLKSEVAAQGKTGRAADRYVYGTMNSIGAMHGNKETAKGAAMERKHARDMASSASAPHPHRNLGNYLHPPKRRR